MKSGIQLSTRRKDDKESCGEGKSPQYKWRKRNPIGNKGPEFAKDHYVKYMICCQCMFSSH